MSHTFPPGSGPEEEVPLSPLAQGPAWASSPEEGWTRGLGALLGGRSGGIGEAFSEEEATGLDMDMIASLQSPRCGGHGGKLP